MFLDGEEVADPYNIVVQLDALAREYARMGRFEPREQLSTRVESMSPGARYVGLGVATLDPGDVPPELTFSDNRPFRGIVALADGTRLLARWGGGLDWVRIESTHTLNVGGTSYRAWTWAGPDVLDQSSEAGRIGGAVNRLHEFILELSEPVMSGRRQRR
jgi:hypothetical protein